MVDCCRKASLKWLMHCVCVCKGWRGHGSGISEVTQCTPVSHLCDGGPLAQIGCEMFIYFQHQ